MTRRSTEPELADLFDERLLSEYEKRTIRRRLRMMRRYADQLVDSARSMERPRGWTAPPGTDVPDREGALRAVAGEALHDSKPELKRGVLRRMVDKAGRHYLYTDLSSMPVFHELTVLGPWAAMHHTPDGPLRSLADYLLGELFNGIVISLQRARADVLDAREVYLAHCACRSAGVVDDLEQDGEVFTLLGERSNRVLLDRVVDRYEALGAERLARTTDPRYRELLGRLAAARQQGSEDYRIQNLLRWTYPDWELIPVHPGYTARWARSMSSNHKAHPIDPLLAFELLNVFFFSRGAVFNSMKAVDSPYCICTCPTPENDAGCVLTNWYYYGRLNHSMIPAEDHHGRRRDVRGEVQSCRYFPVKGRRDCIGCGCLHGEDRPRGLEGALAEADRQLEARGVGSVGPRSGPP